MGRKNQQRRRQRNSKNQNKKKSLSTEWNFVPDAGRGCYIVRRDIATPDWMLEWEDVDPEDFLGEEDEVPDVAIDTDEFSLSLCNVEDITKVAYITVYETTLRGCQGQILAQGSTTDNQGITLACITFIVLCPPHTFAHLCYLDVQPDQDITKLRIESDVQQWNRHPQPSDEHPRLLGFPLQTKSGADSNMCQSFLCTQGEGGALTHFFSGNLHAIDFSCEIGTPLLAVGSGTVIQSKDTNSLTGIAVSNLFEWNSILIQLDDGAIQDTCTNVGGPLFVEYVHIQSSMVKEGDRVVQGQVIGTSGSVGFSPEPHLHFSAFRSAAPDAPTVRVRFEPSVAGGTPFLPIAGNWYDETGHVDPPTEKK